MNGLKPDKVQTIALAAFLMATGAFFLAIQAAGKVNALQASRGGSIPANNEELREQWRAERRDELQLFARELGQELRKNGTAVAAGLEPEPAAVD